MLSWHGPCTIYRIIKFCQCCRNSLRLNTLQFLPSNLPSYLLSSKIQEKLPLMSTLSCGTIADPRTIDVHPRATRFPGSMHLAHHIHLNWHSVHVSYSSCLVFIISISLLPQLEVSQLFALCKITFTTGVVRTCHMIQRLLMPDLTAGLKQIGPRQDIGYEFGMAMLFPILNVGDKDCIGESYAT
jgi:hypothetical protein